jgi:hypothetical protein
LFAFFFLFFFFFFFFFFSVFFFFVGSFIYYFLVYFFVFLCVGGLHAPCCTWMKVLLIRGPAPRRFHQRWVRTILTHT